MQFQPSTADYLNSRNKIIKDFKRCQYGIHWEKKEFEKLPEDSSPLYCYSTGILKPHKIKKNDSDDDQDIEIEYGSDDETNLNNDKIASTQENNKPDLDTLDFDNNGDDLNRTFGLTFITKKAEKIKLNYGFSQYKKEKIITDDDLNHNDSLELKEADKKNKSEKNRDFWVQKKTRNFFEFEISEGTQKKSIPNTDLIITLKTYLRTDRMISSLTIHNDGIYNENIEEQIETDFNYFQVGICIETLKGHFFPIQNNTISKFGKEQESLELLFRNKKSFASGLSCSGDWETNEDSECSKIFTSFIPVFELAKIGPTSRKEEISMAQIVDIESKNEENRYHSLNNLCEEYEDWINQQQEISNSLDDSYKRAANRHITSAKEYLSRMKEGLNLIKNEKKVEQAFRLTNLAMLIQFNRYKNLKPKNGSDDLLIDDGSDLSIEDFLNDNYKNFDANWFPFQIAFLLAIIPDISNQNESNFQKFVDMIWFPTGGGKTEAYLGVLAFTILLRRIKNPENAGVTAIMRYTLRLLTSDQFRRSSALICALEFLRNSNFLNLDLGSKEISIGLWIGRDASPLKHSDAKYKIKNKQYNIDNDGNYKFIVSECPWCKSNISNSNENGYKIDGKKVVLSCVDNNCRYNQSLPIYIWQESVFEEKPTLLLATVDSLAKLPWYKESIDLFSNKFSPAELIIQDEMHLITGPLGSMVALYENALLKILTNEKKSPKIIGASATLTMSGEQAHNLYIGRKTNIFPPQGLNWGESFFAKEIPINEEFGRTYMGYFGNSGTSFPDMAHSAATPILQAPQIQLPKIIKEVNKGDKQIHLDDLFSLRSNSYFTIYNDKGIISKYEIEETNLSNNTLILKEPIDIDIKNETTIFPKKTEIEKSFDPYGTLIWYFNSIKELRLMKNQFQKTCDELSRYVRRFNIPLNAKRNIFERRVLKGQMDQIELEKIIEDLRKSWHQYYDFNEGKRDYQFRGIDIVYSSVMFSVGMDISRLGLMKLYGQPRTTAEYIQASSRVGRRYPGLVVNNLNPFKSRDRSIYEQFKNYHQSIYRFVEPSSITPYSKGAIHRGLAPIFISLLRFSGLEKPNINNQDIIVESCKNWILDAVKLVDPEEFESVEKDMDLIIDKWKNTQVEDWGDMGSYSERGRVRLMDTMHQADSTHSVFQVPTSLRSVDKTVRGKLK